MGQMIYTKFINERFFILVVLTLVGLISTIDIIEDLNEGVSLHHVVMEVSLIMVSFIGVYYVLVRYLRSLKQLKSIKQELLVANKDIAHWKSKATKYIEGLSIIIDEQFESWSFTKAEKEVALLAIKGLGAKEIAEVRSTSEKTIRNQLSYIYKKSSLQNRYELSAFFLEDLMLPH